MLVLQLVTFFFFCLHIACGPYRQSEDNVLKGCADLELFFVMLVTLVKKLGDEDDGDDHLAANDTVPEAFIGDALAPKDYDLMIVVSFFVNVVAAYICVVLYKLANLGLVVGYRKRRSWRQSSKDATALLFDGSGMMSDREFEMTLASGGGDGLGSGLLVHQDSVTTTLPSPSPRVRRASPAVERSRSDNLDKMLGLSVEPQ